MSQRRPPFTSSLTQARETFVRFVVRPCDVLSLTARFFTGFALLTILTTLLLASHHMRVPVEKYREGEVVRRTVVSPADIESIDTSEIETSKAGTTSTGSPTTDQVTSNEPRTETPTIIPSANISLKRNQVVAREGDTITKTMLAQLAAIRAYGHMERRINYFVGLFFIVSALFWAAWKFTEHRSATGNLALSKERSFALVGLSVFVETALIRIGITIANSIGEGNATLGGDPTVLSFAIPFAAAALLVGMLVDTQLALITGFIVTLFAALLAHDGVIIAVYAMVSSSAAIYGIERYCERQSVTLAGLFTGGVNALMAVALIAYSQQPLTLSTILLALGCGMASGLLTSIFAAGGLPINESLFGILTDVKLLELSNADLPLLGQLALRAPGTNQHSHAVGQLAEDAARAIGANALLVRIGALYHDIGKVAAPDMFVENQQHGENPHDLLRPTNSARVITSHVTYGLKLAKQIGLPKKIADFIPQHHGTRTLHYFLRKAQAQAAPDEEINEAEFRYPGPKPQSKEAAIMMLADSCEAATRSLSRPDPENIRAIVVKIVDAIISDGQLDECDLTLRELTTIRETLIISLIGIYHARVDYPGFNPLPLTTGALPPLPQALLNSEERGVIYNTPSEIPIDEGGEVEDEAVPHKAMRR